MPENLVPALPLTPATATPIDAMIEEVASLVGGEQNLAARDRALKMLDRAADRLNMAGVFLFRQTEVTFTAGTDIAASAETAQLPAGWGWPVDPIILRNAAGKLIQRGEWKSWDIFRQLRANGSDTGCPKYFSLRSELDGVLYFAPLADITKFGSIIVSYIARIQRPSEAPGLLLIPEVREAMIAQANALMVQFRYLAKPAIWGPMMKDAERAIEGARAANNRWLDAAHMSAIPEETGNLYGFNSSTTLMPRPVYVQVP